ncbi:hypothetical protein [Falsiphaeobacter marinintestinus]|uniref:hypothetical protein n=1 Tax=Falsiphaeobacter marinintestinus TaxID=1492905 RepID=UPI001644465C|nr:hypothetical protein [Phaeobacter marinintestinus]
MRFAYVIPMVLIPAQVPAGVLDTADESPALRCEIGPEQGQVLRLSPGGQIKGCDYTMAFEDGDRFTCLLHESDDMAHRFRGTHSEDVLQIGKNGDLDGLLYDLEPTDTGRQTRVMSVSGRCTVAG